MSRIETTDLIKEYYDTMKSKYPNLSYNRFEKVCQACFVEVRETMVSEEFNTIRLQFFGTFVAHPKRLLGMVRKLNDSLVKGKVTEEDYERRALPMINYLKKIGHEFE